MLPTHWILFRSTTISLSKILNQMLQSKVFSRKQMSFINSWTALLKSNSIGTCSLKAPILDPHRKHKLKPSLSKDNPDLLEVCTSKVQAFDSLNRSVMDSSAPKIFNYSSFMDPNTGNIIMRFCLSFCCLHQEAGRIGDRLTLQC